MNSATDTAAAGFAFMGREYRLHAGNKEVFLDLLFYNTHLHCYVVAEVKIHEFEAAHLGQLSAYVSMADAILRRDGDNIFARYALDGNNQPLGISEYDLSTAQIADSLPSIEDLERGLR